MDCENKSQDSSTDPELDELLNSALADFDKTQPSQIRKETDSTIIASQAKEQTSEEVTSDGAWSTDFIKQTAEQFEKNFENLIQNGSGLDLEESFQKMAHTVASAISSNPVNDNDEDGSDFQAAIAQTLKDLSATSENLKNSEPMISEEEIAAMFAKTSFDDSSNDFFPFMQGMMQSLLSKEVLYPSLKDLVDKYPSWLDGKRSTLPQKELDRFTKQLDLMQKVCRELENEKDDDGEDVKKQRFDKVLSLMHDMQSCGQPPDELIGDQAGNLQFDPDGNPILPPNMNLQNCNIM
ncbi:peroxisomal biogenesis factor 19 [Chelonus insularis]|uniref:peroxisomal biogenesis factor 19 n=1 Tax=Chelonus insularis TaxID=460826 RepID=UPI00158D8837|nr:peroxisomal biogenesis factor 19 [Chelonus insularis]